MRELYSEIVLHFRQIKQTKRVQSVFLPDQTEFRIAVMDVTSQRNRQKSSSVLLLLLLETG